MPRSMKWQNYSITARDGDRWAIVDRKGSKAFVFESSTSIKYINGLWHFSYSLPCPTVQNSNGYWIPFSYTVRMLGSECFVKSDHSISVSAPRLTILDALNECVHDQSSQIHYNLLDELGTSDFTVANNHNIVMFDKLLKMDPSGWGELFTEYDSDKSAFSKKYGDDYSTLFCTQSAEEARDAAERANSLYDLVSDSGALSDNLKAIDRVKDTDVGFWTNLVNSVKDTVENADSTKALALNRAYQSLDQATKSQDFWNAISKPIEKLQTPFHSGEQTSFLLNNFSTIFEAWTYWHEFEQQQLYYRG